MIPPIPRDECHLHLGLSRPTLRDSNYFSLGYANSSFSSFLLFFPLSLLLILLLVFFLVLILLFILFLLLFFLLLFLFYLRIYSPNFLITAFASCKYESAVFSLTTFRDFKCCYGFIWHPAIIRNACLLVWWH